MSAITPGGTGAIVGHISPGHPRNVHFSPRCSMRFELSHGAWWPASVSTAALIGGCGPDTSRWWRLAGRFAPVVGSRSGLVSRGISTTTTTTRTSTSARRIGPVIGLSRSGGFGHTPTADERDRPASTGFPIRSPRTRWIAGRGIGLAASTRAARTAGPAHRATWREREAGGGVTVAAYRRCRPRVRRRDRFAAETLARADGSCDNCGARHHAPWVAERVRERHRAVSRVPARHEDRGAWAGARCRRRLACVLRGWQSRGAASGARHLVA
jgi:hypothetical protein